MTRAPKKVARRYAQALLEVAKEDNKVAELRDELDQTELFLQKQKELNQFLVNPAFDSATRAEVLAEVANRLGLSRIAQNFMNLLLDKNRFALFAEVITAYQALADELEGRVRAQVIFARPFPDKLLDELVAKIGEISGRKVIPQFAQDSALVGGVVVKIGSLVIDGSIRAQLAAIRESLERGVI